MLPDSAQAVTAGEGVVMCFGTRTPGGAWQWDLTPRAATWNPTDKTFRLHLSVPRRPADAIEIVSSSGPGADLHVRVRRIVVATVPGG